jgi:Swt1-like HEPN
VTADIAKLYEFAFRAHLAEESLDRAGRIANGRTAFDVVALRQTLAIDVLDIEYVDQAEKMAFVYITVAAFENSVRDLIKGVLIEALGENWWEQSVSEKIRKAAQTRMDEERKIRWHVQRGDDPIRFTMLPNLANIIQQNYGHFEDYLPQIEWVKNVFEVVDRSRNVIMHSGNLSDRDIARLGSLIRDWNSQVSI